jgi:hypothetical protein
MRIAVVVWSVLLAGPISLFAQDTLGVVPVHTRSAHAGTLVLAGTAGMLTGAFGAGLIGSQIDPDSGLDDAEGAVIGGIVGTTFATPVAVHLANKSRGNLGRSILVSTLVGGALLGAGLAAESGEMILAIPFAQLLTSVLIEQDTGRR